MSVALYYRPDKMFLNEQLDLMRKSFIYSSKCITYKMRKEEIENYLYTKYKYKIGK